MYAAKEGGGDANEVGLWEGVRLKKIRSGTPWTAVCYKPPGSATETPRPTQPHMRRATNILSNAALFSPE